VLFTLAFGAFIAAFLNKLLYRPLFDLIDYLKASNLLTRRSDELSFISQFLKKLFLENQQLSNDLTNHQKLLHQNLLQDLLRGALHKSSETYALAQQQLTFPHTFFQVILLQIPEKMYPDFLERLPLAHQTADCVSYLIADHAGRAVMVLNYGDNQQDVLQNICRSWQTAYPAFSDAFVNMAIGRNYRDMWEISHSYEEACYACDCLTAGQASGFVHIDAVQPITALTALFSQSEETQLANYLKSGLEDSALKLFEQIAAGAAQRLPSETETLYQLLASTILRAASDLGIEAHAANIFLKLSACKDHTEKRGCLSDYIKKIASHSAQARQDYSTRIYDAMVQYVAENYQKDISLSLLSDRIGYSDSYLSLIFKQCTGESFVDYVNKFRIQKAKSLLESSALSIAVICEQCGFNSANNFNRVFKKYEGITPGQYRKSCTSF